MSALDDEAIGVVRAAYRLAWGPFAALIELTPHEKLHGPEKLRDYIEVLVSSGERDPEKIARSALGLMRQYEQIHRSYARIISPSIEP
jgi:hypothetical protein